MADEKQEGGMAGMGDVFGGMTQLGIGIYGMDQAKKAREQAMLMMEQAYNEYTALGYPPDLSKELAFEEMRQAGTLTPEMEKDIKLEQSAMQEVQQNKELQDVRMNALRQLQEQARTGLTPEERAQQNALQREAETSAEAKRQQIIQDAQARGIAGGGQELAGQYIAAQGGANRALAGTEQTMLNASRRALEALGQGTNLAGQMSNEQLGLDSNKAQAKDLINRFNTENAIQRQTRNINRSNDAQLHNLSEKQRLEDINIAMRNQEKLRANEARRNNWQDNYTLASAKSGARLGQASQASANADQTAAGWQNIASGVGQTVKAGTQYATKDDKS